MHQLNSDRIDELNPYLPATQQIQPNAEGGKGSIHYPGQYQNLVWQTRKRIPDPFEVALINTLETIFEQGYDQLEHVVEQLNHQRVFNRDNYPWTITEFRQFLAVSGY